jgi:protein tyrosine/serine phosphatase
MIERHNKNSAAMSALILLVWLSFCSVSFAGHRGLPAQEGVLNFGRIGQDVYRGAQPDTAAVANLQRLGVKSIIDLRKPSQVRKAEADEAHASGITYTNVPLAGMSRPTDAQVQTVLDLIESLPKPIFIHCQHGCDRTGTIIACYRMKRHGWTHENAWQEAVHYGISWLERGMKAYVKDFARYEKLAKNEDVARIKKLAAD